MDRRGFLAGATALLAAGCARVPPAGVTPSPAPATAAGPALAVGADPAPATRVLAEVLVGALAAKGRAAASTPVGEDWQASLGHGDLAAVPAYAGTLWSTLSQKDEAPAADALLGDLAALLGSDVGILPVPGVDGGLVWLVTAVTARDGITSLGRVGGWSKGKPAAVPALAGDRGDGLPGLRTVYGARFSVDEVEDPIERARRLVEGHAAVAAFRRTEYTGASGLVALVDPEGLATPDPGVILVNAALGDAEPDHVLALDAVAQAMTTEALVDLQAQMVGGGTPSDVARRWLGDQGLA